MTPVALTIAGSDPSGGAGIQADLKTFHQRGVYGMSVVTLLTVQNTKAVKEVLVIGAEKVIAQLDAVLEDMPCHAAKTGALGHQNVIHLLAGRVKDFGFPLIVDPVMVSKHGAPLMVREAHEVFKKELLPYATLVTPNLYEASELAGFPVSDMESMEKAAREIATQGPKAVLVKGGHVPINHEAIDVLYADGRINIFRSPYLDTKHTHGTGCTYSAAITAEIAKGKPISEAVRVAKEFITKAIETSPGLGGGWGPVNHHAQIAES